MSGSPDTNGPNTLVAGDGGVGAQHPPHRFRRIAAAGVTFQGGSAAVDSRTIMAALAHQLTGNAVVGSRRGQVMQKRAAYRIGDAAELVGASVDTLRYYEKIGLLPQLARAQSGARVFADREITRLRFIRRAQAMNFTLAEIGALLELRDRPGRSKAAVRDMARAKVRGVDERVDALLALRDELSALVGACPGIGSECPILAGIEGSRGEAATG